MDQAFSLTDRKGSRYVDQPGRNESNRVWRLRETMIVSTFAGLGLWAAICLVIGLSL